MNVFAQETQQIAIFSRAVQISEYFGWQTINFSILKYDCYFRVQGGKATEQRKYQDPYSNTQVPLEFNFFFWGLACTAKLLQRKVIIHAHIARHVGLSDTYTTLICQKDIPATQQVFDKSG